MSQMWKCSAPVAADPDPRRWVRVLHVPIRTPCELSAQLAAREGFGGAACHGDAGAGGDRAGVLAAPAGGVVVTVGGTVLQAWRGGVLKVLQVRVLSRSRPEPLPRVVLMPF